MKSLDTVKKDFSDVVLVPSLREQMREIGASTANTKLHGAAYRHMLFYGPPGELAVRCPFLHGVLWCLVQQQVIEALLSGQAWCSELW